MSADKNRRFIIIVLSTVAIMTGLTFASVPLYRMFCQVTGFDGTPYLDPNGKADKILDRKVTVRFNADVSAGMPWTFRAENEPVTMKIGDKALVSFYARNNSSTPIRVRRSSTCCRRMQANTSTKPSVFVSANNIWARTRNRTCRCSFSSIRKSWTIRICKI
jgi:cytochrome c oxidase assembly protein Cox11